MADPLFFNGMFNFTDPWLGLQMYKWGWVALLIFSGLAWLAWRYGQWEPYKPVWGLYHAFKGECQAAFIFNAGLVSELLSEKDAKCIFDYSKWKYTGVGKLRKWIFNYATVFLPELSLAKAVLYKYGGRNMDVDIARRLQNEEWEKYSSVTLGGIHTDIILDADRWSVKDSPQHKLIEKSAEEHNDKFPEDQVHAYPKYMKCLLSGKIKIPEGIQTLILVPWARIDSSFQIASKKAETEGAVRQFAREIEETENSSLSKYIIPVLAGGWGFAALLLIMRFGMKFIH